MCENYSSPMVSRAPWLRDGRRSRIRFSRKMQSKSLSFRATVGRLRLSHSRAGYSVVLPCARHSSIRAGAWYPSLQRTIFPLQSRMTIVQSHTTIVGPTRQRIELQIRTRRMHEIAEFGIAAHSLYKEAKRAIRSSFPPKPMPIPGCVTHRVAAEGDNPEEFLEHTKLELFQDQVFCYSPKGKLIALRAVQRPSIRLCVHTNIGDTTVGAKINGRIMPLVTRLNNGDEVEIIRSASRCRLPHGKRWLSPARRALPSAAQPYGDPQAICGSGLPHP